MYSECLKPSHRSEKGVIILFTLHENAEINFLYKQDSFVSRIFHKLKTLTIEGILEENLPKVN